MSSGSLIGGYRVLETLGQGGMSVVYRARHAASERIVALKTVRLQSPWWLESIRREIRALTRIHHPGVVRILDDGVHEGKPWYAMELLEGETLRNYIQRLWTPHRRPSLAPGFTEQVSLTQALSGSTPISRRGRARGEAGLEQGPLPAAAGELETSLRIFRRVCATLAFLHGEGFVNCDLKPENILLVNQEPILIDFGLMVHSQARETLDSGPTMAGTLPYMSPEQIRGEFLDARTDLYSLGCMLYEVLVGSPPFTGPPASIRSAHLSDEALPPSARVADVPAALDSITLKLIKKDLTERSAFADEVESALSGICDDVAQLPNYPPAKPYLYRPRFVGRDEIMAKLTAARDRAATGQGSFVLLCGESGVGKTRVAMEVTHVEQTWPMQVISGDVSSVTAGGATAIARSPLQALRPLLRDIADRCQVGGPEVTERLLGPARGILARYEPLLGDVPELERLPPPIPLSPEASRRQLFECLASTLRALAAELPLVWVIDDVGWADELSLAFLESLTPRFFRTTPLLVLCTHRSEDVSDRLERLMGMPHVEVHRLSRLANDAVSSIVSDMLALPQPTQKFVDFVAEETEGNPFFVAEYLRAAVGERVLHRHRDHTWRLNVEPKSDARGFASLGLPGSLRELIEQRLRRLSAQAFRASIGAAVLGREAETTILRDVLGADDDAFIDVLDELLRRQVLEGSDRGRVRFAHDKVRETAYALAEPEALRELHARAGRAIEHHHGADPDAKRLWPTLGHHFAAAGLHEAAARYLKLAGDQARLTYANEDANRLYGEALDEVNAVLANPLSTGPAADAWRRTAIELQEGRGDVLSLTGRRDEARAAYAAAQGGAKGEAASTRARLHRKLGKTWEVEHQHEAALEQYARACDVIGPEPLDAPAPERDEWIQAHIEQLWVHYWRAQVEAMDAVAERVEPIIRQHGSSAQRGRFFQTRALANMRRDRYEIHEETLRLARDAVASGEEAAGLGELPMAQFVHGFALLLSHMHDAAHVALSRAEGLARRAGDAAHLGRCLSYLAVVARMRRRPVEVERYAIECEQVSTAATIREYHASALANRAWVALREGRPEVAEPLAREALRMWAELKLVFPFQSLALLPLLEIELARGNIAAAVDCARAILAPTQQLLRGPGAEALSEAIGRFDAGRTEDARAALEAALRALDPQPSSLAAEGAARARS